MTAAGTDLPPKRVYDRVGQIFEGRQCRKVGLLKRSVWELFGANDMKVIIESMLSLLDNLKKLPTQGFGGSAKRVQMVIRGMLWRLSSKTRKKVDPELRTRGH